MECWNNARMVKAKEDARYLRNWDNEIMNTGIVATENERRKKKTKQNRE
jgi:hypothetical protein